jgi:two-component system response regulator HydG
MSRPRALIVDDVVDMAETIARDLEGAGFATEIAANGTTALARFRAEPVDVVVTDLRMKGGDGMELLAAIRAADSTVPVVIMTAFGAVESAVEGPSTTSPSRSRWTRSATSASGPAGSGP